jgi:hypothetical protein
MTMVANERLSRLTALVCAALGLFSSFAAAADPWGDVRPRPQDFLGSMSCSSTSCHGGAEIWGPTGLVAHQEYVRWIGTEARYADGRRGYDPHARLESSNADPHSLAAWRMTQPRFQEVLRKASLRSDGSTDANMYQRCAACHDPLGLATGGDSLRNEADKKLVSLHPHHQKPHAQAHPAEENELSHGVAVMRGISCESCHGGAAGWISNHFRRDVSREWLAEHGMIDTKNLLVRARQCAACHVGSADQDMNHDMIAAGHPPLRFEQASYEALLTAKHWNDGPRRAVDPNYEIQLWAAGRVAAADAALALLEGRAKRAGDQEPGTRSQGPWPEFAESNCFACHQPLRSLEGQPARAATAYRTGFPPWQTWNTALLDLVVVKVPATNNELLAKRLSNALAELRAAMGGTFEPSAAEIATKAAAARMALRAAVSIDSRGRVLDRQGRPLDVDSVLQADVSAWNAVSWDEECQRVALLAAANRSLRDGKRIATLQPGSASDWRGRIGQVSRSLRFTRPDREWPAVLEFNSSNTMADVARELESLRRELQSAAMKTTITTWEARP